MLVAPSGGGKSTLCWAILHHGFRYLSDELGPVDLEQLNVHPYPLPPKTVRTSRTLHVTAADIPGGIVRGPAPLSTVFFLIYDPEASAPSVRRLSAGEAAAGLYANALNPLAHAGDGLDAVIRVASGRRCFELTTTELAPTCALLTATTDRSF